MSTIVDSSSILGADTIVAVSTPAGTGGIAVVRVSGPGAKQVVQRRWQGIPIAQIKSHTAHLGRVTDSDGSLLDDAVLTLFEGPHSYTGEDTIELSVHGSAWVQQQLVLTLVDAGARAAEAGEFTRRAFLAGKMDLAQAEAVADLLASTSRSAHRVALNQTRGAFGERLAQMRAKLLHFVSLMELELDFSEEDVTFASREGIITLADEILAMIQGLAASYSAGNAIKNGVPVAIVGSTNAGKSTLLNALLGDERALVSDIAGTTRDVIEDTITLDGTLYRFIDTAGLRADTTDTIEQMGIERSYQQVERAQIVLWVTDPTQPQQHDAKLHELLRNKAVIKLANKADIATVPADAGAIAISAKTGQGLDELRRAIVDAAALPDVDRADTVIVTNARHYQALTAAATALTRARQALTAGLPGDLVSQDIRETLHHLGTITGQITNDEILGEIFAHFCIGK